MIQIDTFMMTINILNMNIFNFSAFKYIVNKYQNLNKLSITNKENEL